MDAVALQQDAGVPGVLTADRRNAFQDGECAYRYIAQMSNRRTDDMQRAGRRRIREERRGPIPQFDRKIAGRTGRVALVTQTCSLNFASSAGRGTAPTT